MIKNSNVLSTDYELFTDESLSNVTLTNNSIGKIIKGLDPNKAYGHGLMRIRILKICRGFICKPLGLIFRPCLEYGAFPQNWIKAIVAPIHKKRQTIK